MRKIAIQATRSVKITDLDEKWLDHPIVKAAKAAKPKPLTEIVVGLPEGSTAMIAESISEALSKDGEVETYDRWSKQTITKLQNDAILKYVNDHFIAPDKRKGGEVLRLEMVEPAKK